MLGYSLSYVLASGHEKAFYWTPDKVEAQNYILRVISIFAETHQFFVTTNGSRLAASEFIGRA